MHASNNASNNVRSLRYGSAHFVGASGGAIGSSFYDGNYQSSMPRFLPGGASTSLFGGGVIKNPDGVGSYGVCSYGSSQFGGGNGGGSYGICDGHTYGSGSGGASGVFSPGPNYIQSCMHRNAEPKEGNDVVCNIHMNNY